MDDSHWNRIYEEVQALIKEQHENFKLRRKATRRVDLHQKAFSNNDLCCVCGLRQNILKCCACQKLYHLHCVKPPLRYIPAGPWKCCLTESNASFISSTTSEASECPT